MLETLKTLVKKAYGIENKIDAHVLRQNKDFFLRIV